MPMFEEYTSLIRQASARVYRVAERTDLVWLKREDQQPVFSYKIRGAYNRMAEIADDERNTRVIAASAGNHAL